MNVSLEILSLFHQASISPVRIPMELKVARHYRHRLNSIRRNMRKVNHPSVFYADAVTIRIVEEGDECTLLLEPKDAELAAVVRALDLPSPPPDREPPITTTPTTFRDYIEEDLRNLLPPSTESDT